MITAAATLGSSTSHLAFSGHFMFIAYIAAVSAVACFVAGVRLWRFPLAPGGPRRSHQETSGLRIELLEPVSWERWGGMALIAELHVRVTCVPTGRPVRLVSFDLWSDPGDPDRPPLVTPDQARALLFDLTRRIDSDRDRPRLLPTSLVPGDSVSGWYANWAWPPLAPETGTPRCVFTVTTDGVDKYEHEIPATSARVWRTRASDG